MRQVGKWKNTSVPLVEINGTVYVLNGWDGKVFTHCWIYNEEATIEEAKKLYIVKPVYRYQSEGIDIANLSRDYSKKGKAFDVIDYIVSPKN